MPTYSYVAKGRDGSIQKGTMSAENRQTLTRLLQARGLVADPKSIREKGKRATGVTLAARRVKASELLIFTRQLATMVNAGLPLLQCLDILAEQTDEENFAEVILAISQAVEGGETFSESLRAFPRAFPDLYVSMVRAGEAGGDLDGVLVQLADYLEAAAELRRRVRGAMTYPVMALSIIMIIASGLILFVVPQFEKIFADMGATLPAPTLVLIRISNVFRSAQALVVAGVGVAIVMALRVYVQTERGRFNRDAFILRLPIMGNLTRKVAVSRFTRTLATLTRSGVPILQAMEIVERTAGNEVFAKAIQEAGEAVRNGESLADPLARNGEFPPMVTRMIGVGEKTGALEVMLDKIADFYDSEIKALVDALTTMIEPLLMVVMGIVVGGIIIALFMPIMNLSSIVNN